MTTEFISNDLCGNPISAIPVVSLQAALNEEELHNLSDVQNPNENLKSSHNVPVLQLDTLSEANVTLHASSNIHNLEKRLSDYISVPMETEVKYTTNYICRLCGVVIDINSAVGIFSNDEFQENLATKINKYLPIIVYESDPFPKTICKVCTSKLNQFHELVEKCVLVEEQLRQTYVFDGRYLEELTKKINQKSDLELLKHGHGDAGQLYSTTDFPYIENIGGTSLHIGKSAGNVKKEPLNKPQEQLKLDSFEINKSEGICKVPENEENFEEAMGITNCKFCKENISDLDNCLEHSNAHMDLVSDQHPCAFCGAFFKSELESTLHIKSHFENDSKMKTNLQDKEKARQQKVLKHNFKILNKVVCCKKCKEALDGVDAAVEHCLKHRPTNIKLYPCVLCVRRVGKLKLRDHIALHFPIATKPVFSCDNCNNLYPDEKTLKYHRCTKLRKYKCSQCKQGFKSEDRLNFHENFHKNKSTFCDICKKDFKFESRIYLHFAGVHNGIRDKPYCCDVCGKTFTWLTVLNSHKRTHTNERPFKCSKCEARFYNKYSLSGHMPSHDDYPQFYCDKCDYHTGRKQNLQKHVSRFHKEIHSSQLCIRCKICNEIFPNKHHAEVEDHLSKHSQIEKNAFFSSYSNEEYKEVFQELVATKLYQCERCERCYENSDHLAHHRRLHDSDDSCFFYQCRLCNSGFSKHDLLVKHQKIHVNIVSQYTGKLLVLTVISCDICGIECVDYRQLLNHKDRGNCMMKKISGTVKPKKVLIKKHLKPLKAHQLFVNSSGLFECPTCQRTYKNRRRYRLHLATHTNISL